MLVKKKKRQTREREVEKNYGKKDRQEKKQNVTDDICENANGADGWRFSLAGGKTPHGRC